MKYHLATSVLGLLFAYLILVLLVKSGIFYKETKSIKQVKGSTFISNTFFNNLIADDSLELQLLASLREKKGITLFGSSELNTNSEFLPFSVLPNKLNLRLNAFGHAFQQELSIYCQLLALKKDLKNAKVCIILSPGWFEENGSNIEAFLEFVRPNFLNRIICDKSISLQDKIYIGKFLSDNYSKIENPNASINYFVNLYRYQSIPVLNDFFANRSRELKQVEYHLNLSKDFNGREVAVDFDFEKEKTEAIKNFKLISRSNKIQVSDTYFNEFIKKENGKIKKGNFKNLNEKTNQELKDFEKLVNLLKKSDCKASFVIQGLNPYHFENLESFDPLLKKITRLLKKEKIPYLNMFTSSKTNYVPGTLIDIMHFGDYGWIEVNEFLYKTYGN